MADTTVEPGAPSAKGVKGVCDGAAPAARSGNASVSLAKRIDRTILRLNKLLASPGGLSAFLSTFNYTLYLLAYLQSKSPSLAQHARRLLFRIRTESASAPAATIVDADAAAMPPIAALAGLISRARATLRLFGLLPLYAWLRSLTANTSKAAEDPVLHSIAVTQCLSYITYQSLENICVLTDASILPASLLTHLPARPTTSKLYLYAYRAWLSGIICDFLRLAREAQIESRHRETRIGDVKVFYEQDIVWDKKWWTDVLVATAWLPMALHFSNSRGGFRGWNLGWMGVCGLVAGGGRVGGLWRGTGTGRV